MLKSIRVLLSTRLSRKSIENEKLREAISSLADEIRELRCSAALQKAFATVALRYFVNHDRSPHTSIPFEKVRNEFDARAIEKFFKSPRMHEAEFAIFRHFEDPSETILDIGANWGFSVASIWASGAKAAILSFEPNQMHDECLKRIKELYPGRHDFVGVAVGAGPNTVDFILPVIDGKAVSALASAVLKDNIAWAVLELSENLTTHANLYFKDSNAPELRFAETKWDVVRLDDALTDRKLSVSIDKIAAIKIDVEGMEASVLCGANSTLEIHKPLVMFEGANRSETILKFMNSLGFSYADFDEDILFLDNNKSKNINGFFVHQDRIEKYRRSGMLR